MWRPHPLITEADLECLKGWGDHVTSLIEILNNYRSNTGVLCSNAP